MERFKLALLAAVVAFIAMAAVGVSRAAADDDPGPDPMLCNAYAPVTGCFYASVSGTDTFNIGTHILHVGDDVSGTYAWEIGGEGGGSIPATGDVAVVDGGPGLKLIDCNGPHRATNAGTYMTKEANKVIKGHTTCKWKAVAATDGWVTSMGLSVDAGGENFLAADFYSVVSRGGVIEGHVREQDVEDKLAAYTGVAGAKVRITGPKGFNKTAATSDTGYYHQLVPRAGTYTVKPEIPKSYWKGGKAKVPDPEFSKVEVKEDKTETADFTVKSSLRVTLEVSRTSVAADGTSSIDATVKATDGGEPAAGQVFSLRPYGGGSSQQSAWDMKVPATVCSTSSGATGGRLWPGPTSTRPNTDSVDVTTDSNGEATLRVYTGTIPGEFPLEVWAENSTGHLITKNVSAVSKEEDIRVKPLGGSSDPTTALENYLNSAGHKDLANDLPTDPTSIVTALATAIHKGRVGDFELAPVRTATSSAVLITPSGVRVEVDPKTGAIDPKSPGYVIAPDASLGSSLAAGGFWGQVKTRQAGTFPTVANWLANRAPGYSFPDNKAPINLVSSFGPLQYLGFGYGPSCI